MKASDHASSALLPIANSLLAQVKAVGQLRFGVNSAPPLEQHMTDRVALIRSFFMLLEEFADLRFDDGETSLCYNNVEWPDEGPLGGSSGNVSVKPSHLVASYFGNWYMEKDGLALAHRLAKIGFWIAHKNGFSHALRCVQDMQRQGLVVNKDTTLVALQLMFGARAAVGDDEPIDAMFGDRRPKTNGDWIKLDLSDFDLPLADPKHAAETLLQYALEQIEYGRNAQSYDEWILANWLISPIVMQCQAVLRLAGLGPTVQPVYDVLEEVRCDSGGFQLLQLSEMGGLRSKLMIAWGLIIVIRAHSGEDWRHRVLHERFLVPLAVQDVVLNESQRGADITDDLPPEWTRVSTTLAPIYASLVSKIPHLGTALQTEEDGDIFRALPSLIEQRKTSSLIETLQPFVKSNPYCDLALAELAIALDEAGKPEDALGHLIDAVILEPTAPNYWQSLGVVLGRLGHREEAQAARAMRLAIANRKPR